MKSGFAKIFANIFAPLLAQMLARIPLRPWRPAFRTIP
jgi:hypothetical protein